MITEDGEAYLEGRLNTETWDYIPEKGKETNSN